MDSLQPSATDLIGIALETGAAGPALGQALTAVEGCERDARAVLRLLPRAEQTPARVAVAERLATPARLGLLLREQPIDWGSAEPIISHLGLAAARPLVEQLILADARAVRRAIMDRLARLGPVIRPVLEEYSADGRWHVVRNVAVLLREAGCAVETVLAERLALHPDARVRREALLLRLERTGARERALSDALRDPDKQVIRAALNAAGRSLPPSSVLVLARRLAEPTFPAELRVLALILLGRSSAPAALEALLAAVAGPRTLLGRPQLAPRSPELVAALAGLARSWPEEPRAREFLRLAARTDDPELLDAIRPLAAIEVDS